MLSLMMFGTRVSLIVGFSAALVAMLIGGAVGIFAGYFGGRIDTLLMRLTDYFISIPDIPLMIVVAAVWGRSLRNIILIIGAIYWTSTARVVRAQVKSIRERGYIRRTRVIGASNTRLIVRHVLPQVAPLLVATTVIMVAYAIFAETSIAFLGLGDPSAVSWGLLIENAFSRDAITRRRVVGDRAAGHRGRDRRRQPDDARHGDRGRAQPAPAREPRLGAALPAAPAPPRGEDDA